MKNIAKLIAPYITTILAAIGVYAEGHTKMAMMEYRITSVEKSTDDLGTDIKDIKSLLYSIDTRLSIFGVQLEERTGK